jgi:hypothetical protein
MNQDLKLITHNDFRFKLLTLLSTQQKIVDALPIIYLCGLGDLTPCVRP